MPKKKPIVENLYPIKAPGVIDYLVNLIRIVDNDEDIKKVIFSKARNCLVIKERQNAKYVYSELGFNGRCVTLDGEQISSLKYVYETPHLKKLKGFLSIGTQKEQVENLEQRINDISHKIVSLKTKQKELDKGLSNIGVTILRKPWLPFIESVVHLNSSFIAIDCNHVLTSVQIIYLWNYRDNS